MRIFLIPLIALGSASFASASEANSETPAQIADFDVSGKVFNPLDAAAQHANEAPKTAATKTIVTPSEQPAKPESVPATPNKPAASTEAVKTAPLFSPVPAVAQDSFTQIGGIDLNPYNTPLEEVVRQLARYLDRPVNISLIHKYKVTGSWTQATAIDILRDIVESKGLVLKETTIAYQLEDHGRTIQVPSAVVKNVAPKPATSALAESLSAAKNSGETDALEGKKLEKAISKNNKSREKALQERKQLLQNLD